MPSFSVASPFILHCYTFCIIERFPFIIHNLSPPLSFSLFYLAFHRFVVTDLFLHLHGLILHPSIYYWQDQPDSSVISKKKLACKLSLAQDFFSRSRNATSKKYSLSQNNIVFLERNIFCVNVRQKIHFRVSFAVPVSLAQ